MNGQSPGAPGAAVGGQAISIVATPLTRAAFASFGDVIGIDDAAEGGRAINQQTSRRFDDLVKLDLLGGNGVPRASLVRARPASFPIRLRLLERHPFGSQLFLPLGAARFLVVVALGGEPRGAQDLRAFLTNGRQGVNYRPGVWHHPVLALDQETDFLVIDRSPEADNYEERILGASPALEVAIAPSRAG